MTNKKATTYDNLVKYYNRGIHPYTTCECGKIITENKLASHQSSTLHLLLMRYKEQCEKLKKQQQQQQPVA